MVLFTRIGDRTRRFGRFKTLEIHERNMELHLKDVTVCVFFFFFFFLIGKRNILTFRTTQCLTIIFTGLVFDFVRFLSVTRTHSHALLYDMGILCEGDSGVTREKSFFRQSLFSLSTPMDLYYWLSKICGDIPKTPSLNLCVKEDMWLIHALNDPSKIANISPN